MSKKQIEMNEDKRVLLSQIIERINVEIPAFVDLSNEKIFSKICKDLTFRNYVPLNEKRSYLRAFSLRASMLDMDIESPTELAVDLEKISILYLLLEPYVNIEIDAMGITDEDFDTLEKSGFINKVMQLCGNDYYKMQELLNESYRIESIIRNYEAINTIDLEKMNELTVALRTMFDNLDEEQLKHLDSIITANDPTYGALKQFITTPGK